MSSVVLKLLSTAFNLAGSHMERLTDGWIWGRAQTTSTTQKQKQQHGHNACSLHACLLRLTHGVTGRGSVTWYNDRLKLTAKRNGGLIWV